MRVISFSRSLRSLRLRSLCTSAVLSLLFLALCVGAVAPRVANAQAVGSGVTCSVINGVDVCTQQGTGGQICVSGSGSQECENVATGTTGSSDSTSLGQGLGSTQQPTSSGGSSGWLSQLTNWVANAIDVVFDAIVAFLKDMVTFVVATILGLVSAAISAVGTPSWMSSNSLQGIIGPAASVLGYFMSILQIPQGFALIAGGYVFRLTRKFLTLFQW